VWCEAGEKREGEKEVPHPTERREVRQAVRQEEGKTTTGRDGRKRCVQRGAEVQGIQESERGSVAVQCVCAANQKRVWQPVGGTRGAEQ